MTKELVRWKDGVSVNGISETIDRFLNRINIRLCSSYVLCPSAMLLCLLFLSFLFIYLVVFAASQGITNLNTEDFGDSNMHKFVFLLFSTTTSVIAIQISGIKCYHYLHSN